ncbi:ParB/Srx family N-terminal domain-containing protein [uncultured Cedecea sp.]|uniref:ParB/Srx family N-terminal domain-containing protein n=1 Tax=uncultured Cedecea sp. TaxID=988762 RepID=UPI00261C19FD|nr:ParB/Srx family N-terminal domain-containing protein [uncultured Cedecea sp.]
MKYLNYVLLSLLSVTAQSWATDHIANTPGVIQLKAADLRPTQPSIGDQQVNYKIASYALNPKKLYADYCEDNGAEGVDSFTEKSSLLDLNSFKCLEPYGSKVKDLKTAVIGPDKQYYLTDGHHLVSMLNKVSGGDTPVFIRITDDKSAMGSMEAFWNSLAEENLTWLKDAQFKPVNYSSLPKTVSEESLQNDQYRSIMYFLRGVSYKKPKSTNIPFFEFYLAEWLNKKVPVDSLKLDTREDYYNSLQKVADAMLSVPADEVVVELKDKKFTVSDFGVFNAINKKELNKLIDQHGKLTVLFTAAQKS